MSDQHNHPPHVLRAICAVSIRVAEKAFLKPDFPYWRDYIARGKSLDGAMQGLFSLACDLEVGEHCESEDLDELVRALPAHTKYCVIDIAVERVLSVNVGDLLRQSNYVGMAVFPEDTLEWVYWRPVEYPLQESRIVWLIPQAETSRESATI